MFAPRGSASRRSVWAIVAAVAVLAFGAVAVGGGAAAAPTCGLSQLGQWDQWGEPGFEQPIVGAIDVDVDIRGNVYVSAEADWMIHVFTREGSYIRSFDADSPHGLAVDRGRVYNASWGTQKVQVFSTAGDLLLEWGDWDEDGSPMSFVLPLFIDVDVRGFIYVTDAILGQVRMFTPDGEWVRTFGAGASNGVAAHAGKVYVANAEAQRIDVFTTSGVFLTSFGGPGDGDGEFSDPRGVAAGGGSVYVTDTDQRRVQAFSLNGTYRSQATDSDFLRLDGAGTDGRGNVYITDQFTNLVTWFGDTPGRRSCS